MAEMTIDQAVKEAKELCTNGYVLNYLNTIPEAIEFGGHLDECGGVGQAIHAYRVQLLYAYSNMQYWRDKKGENKVKGIKAVIKKYLIETGYMK